MPAIALEQGPERQDRLGEGIGGHDFIMKLIVAKAVGRTDEFRCQSRNHSIGHIIWLRQPGEGRNLRVGDSVRYENLIPLTVVG